jgi:hypothetical protein
LDFWLAARHFEDKWHREHVVGHGNTATAATAATANQGASTPAAATAAAAISDLAGARREAAKTICLEFVSQHAERQVNLHSQSRTTIMERVMDDPRPPPANVFAQAQMEIHKLLATDAFPRFRRSNLFEHMLRRVELSFSEAGSLRPGYRKTNSMGSALTSPSSDFDLHGNLRRMSMSRKHESSDNLLHFMDGAATPDRRHSSLSRGTSTPDRRHSNLASSQGIDPRLSALLQRRQGADLSVKTTPSSSPHGSEDGGGGRGGVGLTPPSSRPPSRPCSPSTTPLPLATTPIFTPVKAAGTPKKPGPA